MDFQLPDGWIKERGAQANTFVLKSPEVAGKSSGGFVTIDEKQRGYAMGCYAHVSPMPYSGLGWKAMLYSDAAAALAQAVKLEPKKNRSGQKELL